MTWMPQSSTAVLIPWAAGAALRNRLPPGVKPASHCAKFHALKLAQVCVGLYVNKALYTRPRDANRCFYGIAPPPANWGNGACVPQGQNFPWQVNRLTYINRPHSETLWQTWARAFEKNRFSHANSLSTQWGRALSYAGPTKARHDQHNTKANNTMIFS